MSTNKIFTPLVLIAAICAVIALTYIGCNSSSKTPTETADSPHTEEGHEGHDHAEESQSNVDESSAEKSELDKKIDAAIASINESKANPSGGMPEGIMTLVQISRDHPDNERVNFQLGLLSIESGQYDKALKRFEKLVSLHPENEEYKLRVEEVKGLLNDSAQ